MDAKNKTITKGILTTTFAAVATAGLLVAAAWPGLLDAKDPLVIRDPSALRVPTAPAVTVQGCKLTAQPPKTPAKPGETSIVSIKAVNPADKPVHFEAMLTAMSQEPGSRFARRLVLPTPTWQRSFTVALGPIKAQFSGSGVARMDDATRSGRVLGKGRDALSRTSVDGAMDFTLTPEGDARTRLALTTTYALRGPLAQFGRKALVEEVADRLIAEIAARLAARSRG